MLVAWTASELNFDEFKSGRLHEKHAVATLNLGTISAFAEDKGESRKPVSTGPVSGPS
jgi:hypothetical protein